jgi:hypothetical protein
VQSKSRQSRSPPGDNFATAANGETKSKSTETIKVQMPPEITIGDEPNGQVVPFGLVSPNTDMSESDRDECSVFSFDSAITPQLTLSADAQDNKINGFGLFCRQPSCHNEEAQDVQEEKVRVEAPVSQGKEQPKNTWFSFLCRQETSQPVEKQAGEKQDDVAAATAVEEEGSAANNKSVNDAPLKANFLENACEAACQCIAQDEFADLLEDSMRVGSVRREKKRPKSKKKKKPTKKRSKKDKLLSPIEEEAGDAVTPLPAHSNRETIVPVTEQTQQKVSNAHIITTSSAPPVKKKKRRFFNIFRRKKQKTVTKEKDVLSLIQSDTFMVGIMNEIKLDIQQPYNNTSDDIKNTKDGVVKSEFQFNDELSLPDGFSVMLAEQIAEEAVKICSEEDRR